MKRTIAIKIDCSKESCNALNELSHAFSTCCNKVAEIAENTKESNRVRLHHESYYVLRESLPQLGSQMTCNAIAKVLLH